MQKERFQFGDEYVQKKKKINWLGPDVISPEGGRGMTA